MIRTALAALALCAGAAQAAEVTPRPDLAARLAQLVPIYGEHGGTPVRRSPEPGDGGYDRPRVIGLSGAIVPGDAARLDAVIAPDGPNGPVSPFLLVMESPGGSFLEGIALGALLQQYREGNGDPALLGVVILDGTACLSACAVAFALAARPRDSGFSVRYVELGARLGFHMPFVPVDQQAVQTEIARAMDLTYDVMSEYISLVGNGIAPTALVQNALHYRRPDDFFVLRGGMVTRFMDFVPVAGPEGSSPLAVSGLTQDDALKMCQIKTFSKGRDMLEAEYEFWPAMTYARTPGDTPLADLFTAAGSDNIAIEGCEIARLDGDRLGLTDQAADCPEGAQPGRWCALPADDPFRAVPAPATGALLGDSLGCHGGQLMRAHYHWDQSNAFLEEEDPARYRWEGMTDPDLPLRQLDWRGAALKSNVNMRDAPGGARLAQLERGTGVTVTDCRLNADGQGVWYRVQAGAKDGWVSARYVGVPGLASREAREFVLRPAGVE